MEGSGKSLKGHFRVQVRVVNISPHPFPVYSTSLASGADIHAWIPEGERILPPLARTRVRTGLYFEIPPGYEMQIRPRSGLADRLGLTVLNTPGTIDADYRGELQILVINLGAEPVRLTDGMRIAQAVLCPVVQAEWVPVSSLEELSSTSRGRGGFGHTGV